MKRTLAIVLAFLLVLSAPTGFAETAEGAPTAEEVKGSSQGEVTEGVEVVQAGTVVYGCTVGVKSFGPWTNQSDGNWIYNEIFEWLFNYESFGGDLVGIIGKSYEQIDDTTYRVYLYDYVHDSLGNPIKAEDVVFSYDKCREEGFYTNRIMKLDHIDIVDDYTLDFVYSSAPDYASLQESLMISIVNKAYYESQGKEAFELNPVGTGTYKLKEFVEGSTYTLAKVEDYWQTNESAKCWLQNQNCDVEIYKVIPDSAQMAIALETGEIDVASIDSANISFFYDTATKQAEPGYFVDASLNAGTYTLVLNASENSVLKDQNARLACLYAIDNQAIVDLVLDGQGLPAYTVGGSNFRGFQQKMADESAANCYACDIPKAKEYLAAAGYGENELPVRLMCPAFLENFAVAIQGQLIAAGIDCQVLTYAPPLFESNCLDLTQFDIYIHIRGKAAGTLPAFWGHDINGTHYKFGSAFGILDEKLEALYLKSTSQDCTDEDIMAVHDYVAEQGYCYGLCNAMQYYVAREGIVSIAYTDQYHLEPGCCFYSAAFGK